MTLYAPSQNGLVERFNRTLSEKFKECERFGWKKIDAMSKLLLDYRGTPHSTTGVSPFEAMFGRKMRNDVSRLHPRLEAVPAKKIERDLVEEKQDEMKRVHDVLGGPREWDIQIGDYVRVLGQDKWLRDYDEVIEVGENSVTLKVGGKWPIDRVTQLTSRKVAIERKRYEENLRERGFSPRA